MKSTSLQSNIQEPYLKVIKNNTKRKKSITAKIYINTMMPNFSFTNHLGETITRNNCVLL